MESAKKRTAEKATERATPTTSNLASLLITLKESDGDINLGDINPPGEVRLELVKDNCNCKKSRCLKLYVYSPLFSPNYCRSHY